jgi:D-threo-aldose 1-dehydrogenase
MKSTLPTRPVRRSGVSVSEIGFGAAPLGNLYQPICDAMAHAALRLALNEGIRYIDTAPYYGFGLSERRVGDGVRGSAGVVVSTKVGRLLTPAPETDGNELRNGFRSPMPFSPRFDYTYDGIMRSWDASLHRLGLATVDILYVHDIGRLVHHAKHDATFGDLTQRGGFRALEQLRAAGEIKAFGLGVNEWQICLEAMEYADIDIVLLAGRYTLLDQSALAKFLPACIKRETAVVIGGVYNSGILATGTRSGEVLRYNYEPATPSIIEQVQRIEAICDNHRVRLPAAALQFPLAHPTVVSVIPGLDTPARVAQTLELYREPIPAEFWGEMRRAGLLPATAAVPAEAR